MTKTDQPGVYKRGERYAYTYRKRGRQRWGTARTKAEARRLKHQAETDVARGEHRDSTRLGLLFAAGKNVKQVQVWLGHADPGFTVRTCIHLMDDGLGDAGFLDGL